MINNFKKISYNSKKKYKDGEYVGELKNGLRDGKGTFYYNENNKYERKIYEGEWKNDRIEGKGEMTWVTGEKYIGDWKNNEKDGLGIQYYSNKNKEYEGNFKNGFFEGKGVYYYDDGNRYEGDWKNNKREGDGIIYFQKGGKSMGKFLNGLAIGKFTVACIVVALMYIIVKIIINMVIKRRENYIFNIQQKKKIVNTAKIKFNHFNQFMINSCKKIIKNRNNSEKRKKNRNFFIKKFSKKSN